MLNDLQEQQCSDTITFRRGGEWTANNAPDVATLFEREVGDWAFRTKFDVSEQAELGQLFAMDIPSPDGRVEWTPPFIDTSQWTQFASPDPQQRQQARQTFLPQDLASRVKERPSPVTAFNALQEWDGYVVSIDDDSFKARITDITNDGRPDEEEVEIPLSELDEESQSQLVPGQLFRWSIGYQRARGGQKSRVSRIVLRRLPSWTRADLCEAEIKARSVSRKLEWE